MSMEVVDKSGDSRSPQSINIKRPCFWARNNLVSYLQPFLQWDPIQVPYCL